MNKISFGLPVYKNKYTSVGTKIPNRTLLIYDLGLSSTVARKNENGVEIFPNKSLVSDDTFIWFFISASGEIIETGKLPTTESLSTLQQFTHNSHVVLMISTALVGMHSINVPGKFTKQIEQNLIYQIEELLAQDIDSLYCKVIDKLSAQVNIAVVSRELIDGWQSTFKHHGIKLDAIIPDAVCCSATHKLLPLHRHQTIEHIYSRLDKEPPSVDSVQEGIEQLYLLKLEGNWICFWGEHEFVVLTEAILEQQIMWVFKQFATFVSEQKAFTQAPNLEKSSSDALVAKAIDFELICHCQLSEQQIVLPLLERMTEKLSQNQDEIELGKVFSLKHIKILNFKSIGSLYYDVVYTDTKLENHPRGMHYDRIEAYNLLPKSLNEVHKPLFSKRFRNNFIAAVVAGVSILSYQLLDLFLLTKQKMHLEHVVIDAYNTKFSSSKKSISAITSDLKRMSTVSSNSEVGEHDFLVALYHFPKIFQGINIDKDSFVIKELGFSRTKNELNLKVELKSHQDLKQIQLNAAKFFNVVDSPILEKNQRIEATLIWQVPKR